MARLSFLLTLMVASMAAMLTTAFAPAQTYGVRPSTTALPVKIKVDVGDGEPIESALRRFKREVNKSGHLMELRHKRYFENPQEKKKRKVKEARMRKKFERMNRRRIAQRT
ncbi:protein S21 [Seminavis robusta]|uniref:Protein S21 n=1 Tax=Seminavis robusta TaxID=568900 RepID=A0A9N8DVQ3_9STRA|nr:protein S21 [Seminavis robusta]|eukprot:Sro408_g136810.1 protein S21 (111) ;mRNA; r:3678-4189